MHSLPNALVWLVRSVYLHGKIELGPKKMPQKIMLSVWMAVLTIGESERYF